MSPEPERLDWETGPTFAAVLDGPIGELPVEEVNITRSAGTSPDNINVTVLVDRGKIRDFDPLAFWTLKLTTRLRTEFISENLTIERLLAVTSNIPRTAEFLEGTQIQKVRLTLTDVRSRWPGRGALRGPRNLRAKTSADPQVTFDPISLRPDGQPYSLADLIDEIVARLWGVVGQWGPESAKERARTIIPENIDYGLGTFAVDALSRLSETFGLIVGLDWDSSVSIDFLQEPLEDFSKRSWEGRERSLIEFASVPELRNVPGSVRAIPKKVFKEISVIHWEPAVQSDGTIVHRGKVVPKGGIVPLKDVVPQFGLSMDDVQRYAYAKLCRERDVGATRAGIGETILKGRSETERRRLQHLLDSAYRLWIPKITPQHEELLAETQDQARQERAAEIAQEEQRAEEPQNPNLNWDTRRLRPLKWQAVAKKLLKPPWKLPKDVKELRDAVKVYADYALYGSYAWYEHIAAAVQRARKRGRRVFPREGGAYVVEYDYVSYDDVECLLARLPRNPLKRKQLAAFEEVDFGGGRHTLQGNLASFAQDRPRAISWPRIWGTGTGIVNKSPALLRGAESERPTSTLEGGVTPEEPMLEGTISVPEGRSLGFSSAPFAKSAPVKAARFFLEAAIGNNPGTPVLRSNYEYDTESDGRYDTPGLVAAEHAKDPPSFNPPPLGVFWVYLASDATMMLENFDPETGALRFKQPVGIPEESMWARAALQDLQHALLLELNALKLSYVGAGPYRLPRFHEHPHRVLWDMYIRALKESLRLSSSDARSIRTIQQAHRDPAAWAPIDLLANVHRATESHNFVILAGGVDFTEERRQLSRIQITEIRELGRSMSSDFRHMEG